MKLIEFKQLSNDEQTHWIKENKHKKDLEYIWNQIYWIKNQKFGQEEKKDNKETKPKRKCKVKIPIQYCKSIHEIQSDEEVDIINYYPITLDNHEYIIDVISTKQKHFYVHITDITNEYKEIDFYEFKNKYSQPSLFDNFFDI